MNDDRIFIPWRALKPRVFWSFLIGWNVIGVLAFVLNSGHGGALLTPASNILAVTDLLLALTAVLLLLLSERARTAALREGQDIELCRTHLWFMAAGLGFLVVAFSAQACSVL